MVDSGERMFLCVLNSLLRYNLFVAIIFSCLHMLNNSNLGLDFKRGPVLLSLEWWAIAGPVWVHACFPRKTAGGIPKRVGVRRYPRRCCIDCC
jgi:hypothetical protein